MSTEQKQKILIVDDSELNRAILADILDDEYEIIEAENGLQGVGLLQQRETDISLVLLDIVMPEMDGFGVLGVMAENHWIEDIPPSPAPATLSGPMSWASPTSSPGPSTR